MSQHLLPEHWAPSSHLARTRKDTETEADRDRETWKRTQRAKQAAEVVTYSHVISLRAQNPEERNRDPRERPRVTQRPRAPSPELLKQTRDQGCGSPASLPLSLPSSHSSVSSPSCASSTHPKQNSLGPGSLCPRTGSQPPPCSSWLCVCVCVCACVCACAHASECSSVHVLPSVCYSWPVPTIALGPPRAMGIHTDTNTHTHTLREHTGAQAQRGQTQPHAETDTQGHRRTYTSPLTHTLLSTFSLAQIMYTFIDMPHSQPHSFTPGNMPSVSLSLHIYTQGQKIHHAYSKCHLLKFPQPAIRPSATPEGFPTRHPQGKT